VRVALIRALSGARALLVVKRTHERMVSRFTEVSAPIEEQVRSQVLRQIADAVMYGLRIKDEAKGHLPSEEQAEDIGNAIINMMLPGSVTFGVFCSWLLLLGLWAVSVWKRANAMVRAQGMLREKQE